MKPTQAQIEAAKDLRKRLAILVKRGGNDWLLTNLDMNLLEAITAALTAAAGVDRGVQTGKALTGNLNEVSLGENSESVLHRHTAAAEVGPIYKMEGKLDEDTHRLWRAINGLDIDDFDKRAEAFTHSTLDGLQVGPGNRATVKSLLAENFEQLAKDREAATIERCAQVADRYAEGRPGIAWKIAAAIRALKDKP